MPKLQTVQERWLEAPFPQRKVEAGLSDVLLLYVCIIRYILLLFFYFYIIFYFFLSILFLHLLSLNQTESPRYQHVLALWADRLYIYFRTFRFDCFCAQKLGDELTFVSTPGVTQCGWLGPVHQLANEHRSIGLPQCVWKEVLHCTSWYVLTERYVWAKPSRRLQFTHSDNANDSRAYVLD